MPRVWAKASTAPESSSELHRLNSQKSRGLPSKQSVKIEHGEGNPQLDVFCSLITVLGIDPSEIVYSQKKLSDPARKQLEIMLADCSDEQIRNLLPVVEAALGIVKGQSLTTAK